FSIDKDKEAMAQVHGHWQKLVAGGGVTNESLQQYRWMVEEFRVSVFAQTLGTSLPVSAKRLEKEWQRSAPR
ncbi:MAG: ATP-dependent helicase HrpA, partial [Candidatus Pseudothioglobus sp.]